MACAHPLDSTGVAPSSATGCRGGGRLLLMGHWVLICGYGVHPGPHSLFPLGHSQGWRGSVHPGEGEEELMFIHEALTWVWLRR